jgi:hypothetical protein
LASSAATARRIILALPDTVAAPHMDREAFRAGGAIFATLREDGVLNVKLTPEFQEIICAAEPAKFRPVAGGWGRMGFTTIDLGQANETDLQSALRAAWEESRVKKRRPRKKG